jgi:CMP-N-acetylneuraminic acid synthetase
MRVLAVIPARGGSKGIPRKNIRFLCGKPLLQYTAEAALLSRTLNKVILSTDDPEIIEIGLKCGLDVPFIRPTELAQDDTPTLPVIQHAMRFLEEQGESYDAVCILQPTNPLRKPEHIDACVQIFLESSATSVLSVLEVPVKYNPHWVYLQNSEGYLQLSTGESSPIPRRQDLPTSYHRDGSLYLCDRNTLMENNSLYGSRIIGYVMSDEYSINIDSEEDWERAENILCSRIGAKYVRD